MDLDFNLDDWITKKMNGVSRKFDDAYWREISRSRKFPDKYWDALAGEGLFGVLIENKYGGIERGLVDLCLATKESAEHYAGLGSYLYLSGSLVSKIFSENATPEMKEDLLPKLARGQLKISIALTEEESGQEVSAIQTKATKCAKEEFVISGSKTFVNNADLADYLLIFARTKVIGSVKKTSGLTMFLAEADSKAIKKKKLEKLGMDFVNNFSVKISDLRVSSSRIVGVEDEAWHNIVKIFNMDRVATSASLTGTGRLALSHASKWAKDRKVFGKSIGANQGIQFPLADAIAQIEIAEAMMLKAASLADQGKTFANEANYALLESSGASQVATDRALQTLGGHGYYRDYDVERYWRDVRVYKLHPISEEMLLASIAERSLGLPRSY
jgi:acyl-CoA dehydrogenase